MLRVSLLVVSLAAAQTAAAQGVREHTRLVPRGTAVSESQAEALTLTMGAVTSRLVQTWIRAAGTIDKSNRVLSADLAASDAAIVKVGQRVRAFPPSSKSSMYQAFVTRVFSKPGGATVDASLAASGRQNATVYVIEIVVEQGPFLSVPNEAIIEEGDRRVVYVQQQPGQYTPREIQTGLQGELYTQVLSGVQDGDQVVTFGSFFIDAEHKLKGTEQDSSGARHQ
jgi:Cu(I)/Ag(I) efflux system membrane fusion protein